MTGIFLKDIASTPSTLLNADEFGAGPHPVDRHVGLRIRMRRKSLGISQERLAESLGLTFQQVQKYERGVNRVSASKLWAIARALKTNVASFYEGLEDGHEVVEGFMDTTAQEFLLTPEGIELAATFPTIRKAGLRRKVLDLVRAMADAEAEAGGNAHPVLVKP